ncbi:MAG TPA: nuclear transport factor 2 family protein [Rhodocyclaceae bacterium]|jgi:ketosteroid isomerase-like protein|nr:nuclear transport factor 2 family protein [Rhodocyclaceae bacterium]
MKPTEQDIAERKALIKQCFAAFNAKDRTSIEALLASDFTFTSPYDDTIDRAMYFERCWPNSDRIRQHVIERIFVENDAAFVTYKAITHDGTEFRNTEFFTFKGGQIASVNVYFGATYKNGTFVISK